MAAEIRQSDLELIERYSDQPARLPVDLRRRIERHWGGDPVHLYALADLDASMRLSRTWIALGPEEIAIVVQPEGAGRSAIRSFERKHIQALGEAPGLSCNVLTILGEPGEPALAVLRYTHRQRSAIENIVFLLREQVEGRRVSPGDSGGDAEYVDGLAGPIRSAQAMVAGNELAVLWRLLAYLIPYKRSLATGLFAATLITLFSLVPPYLAGALIDRVVEPARAGRMPIDRASWIAGLAVAGLAVIYVLRQIAAWVRLRLMAVLGEYVARDLRTDLYEHMQTLSLSFYSRKRTGSLITRVSSDTDRLWEFLAFGVVDVSLSIVTLIGLGTVLLILDWRLGLVMTLPVPVLCWLIYRHGEKLNRVFLRAWRKWSAVTDVLGDTIPGMKVVKAFSQEEREKKRFDVRNRDVTGEFNRIHHMWTLFWPILMLAIHGMTIAVWAFALPRLLGTASPDLSAGMFVSFLLYTTMFVSPIEIIGQVARILNRATTSAHRVFEVLDTEPEVVDTEAPLRLEPVRGRLEFDNVSFGYDGLRQVLRGVSFSVEPGEMIGLVGPSGGGKSTIANLIARFYDVTGGAVRIDGVDVRDLDTGHYRGQLGMVLQDPFLFHGTILDNLRYGVPEASVGEVVEAAEAANAHDFICCFEHGYDTVVGERGHTLSGGERQRVSIARAILGNPRILILDEATSSVDSETERKIQEALDRLISDRTVIAIAHRLSTLRKATRIFVVEDGRIPEDGSHAQLLEREGGIYRRLYSLQRELAHAL